MISGPIDLTEDEFSNYYVPDIKRCMNLNYYFVVGGSNGADKLSQLFFKSSNYKRVTVYDKGEDDNRYWDEFDHKNNFKNYPERDNEMTKQSNGDIAFIRLNRGICSTVATNIVRRWFSDSDARKFEKLVKEHMEEDHGIGCKTSKRIQETFPTFGDKLIMIINASFMETLLVTNNVFKKSFKKEM